MGLFNRLKESIDQTREQVKQEFEEAKEQFKQAYEGTQQTEKSSTTATKPVGKPIPLKTVKPAESAASTTTQNPKSATEQYLAVLEANMQKAQQQRDSSQKCDDWKNQKHVEIPEGVTEISNDTYHFSKNLESVVLPSTIVRIGETFRQLNNLKSVDLSKCTHLETIEDNAFSHCGNIESVSLPPSIVNIGEYAFFCCKRLESISLSHCVQLKTLGESAFEGCDCLKSVTLPDSLISIAKDCFSRTNLTEIVIPDSVELIGSGAFSDNPHLSNATIGRSVSGYAYHSIRVDSSIQSGRAIFDDTPELKELCFRSRVVEFTGVKTLTNVVFADTVKEIGYWAFAECKELEEIIIPDSVGKIGYGSFAGCESLASITIPDCVTEIGEGAFSGTAIKELVFPAELRELGRLGENLFKLRKLDFSKVRKLEVIPEAFLGDSPKVKELTLPMGVKEIEEEIGGENLNKLFLPPTIERVDDLDQMNLNIYCYAPKIEELGLMVEGLDDPEEACHLFVLPENLEDYKAQLEAEDIEEGILTIDVIPEELRYYYDN